MVNDLIIGGARAGQSFLAQYCSRQNFNSRSCVHLLHLATEFMRH